MAENKPNAMVLHYPAVTIPNLPGADYMLKLLTGRREVTDADADALNMLTKIDKNAPPVFLVATAEDYLTNWGAMPVAQKYSQLGLGYELHIFQFGPHGYSLADETCADGSSQVLDEAYAQWHELSVKWIHRTFGKPTFVDKSTSRMMNYVKDLGFEMPGGGAGNA